VKQPQNGMLGAPGRIRSPAHARVRVAPPSQPHHRFKTYTHFVYSSYPLLVMSYLVISPWRGL